MTSARVQEVEALLAVADLGPDFEPTALGHDLKDLSKDSKTSATLEKDFEKLAQKFSDQEIARDSSFVKYQNELKTSHSNEDLPDVDTIDIGINVKSDIYNVDHAAMMNKIQQSVKHKSHRFTDVSADAAKIDPKKFSSKKDLIANKTATKGKSEKSISKKMLAAEEQDLSRQSFTENVENRD